jgi:prepilin-type processing-associated H-X9-DG protein
MRRFLVRTSLGFLVLFMLACIGIAVPLDLAFAVVFGWIIFLIRVLPEVRINGWGVATAVACLVPLAVGTQWFLGWLCQGPAKGSTGDGLRWRLRWTGGSIAIVVLMFVAGLAAGGVAHQVVWLVGSPEPLTESEGGRASVSISNLKAIGQALHDYQRAHGTFPPGATFDHEGRPLQSWQAMILPYMLLPSIEQEDVFEQINVAIPWDDPRNAAAFRTEINVYRNPGIAQRQNKAGYALSHYAGNARMLGGDARRTLNDVTDGTANTIMAGEAASRFKPWGDPTNWRDPALGVNRSPDGFGSPFVGGANFLFVDGSIHFIKNTVDPNVLKALSTPRGGERVSSDEY